ncbi:MAG: right-handed parallel beta-helix repeat-containing protein [Sedimentisphaerales bacterium]
MKMNWFGKLTFICIMFMAGYAKGDIQSDISTLGTNGGTVIIPAGETVVTATIMIPSNVSLKGACTNSVLKAANGFNGDVIKNADQINGNSGIRMSGFSINGNKPYQTAGNGINLKKVSDIVIEDVKVRDCYTCGIYLDADVTEIRVESCIIYGNGVSAGNGIQTSSMGLSNLLITNCTIYSNKNNGIYIGGTGYGIKVIGNYIYGHGSGNDGIKVYDTCDIVLAANVIDGASNGGMELNMTSNSIITANCVANANHGINVSDSNNYIVNGNVAFDNVIGIYSSSVINRNGALVSNNVCMNNDIGGIYSCGMQNSIFSANACIDNGISSSDCYGIYVKGISGSPVTNVMINANECIDSRTTGLNYEKYGIWLEYIDKSVVSDGIFRGANTSNLYQGVGVTNLTTNSNITN